MGQTSLRLILALLSSSLFSPLSSSSFFLSSFFFFFLVFSFTNIFRREILSKGLLIFRDIRRDDRFEGYNRLVYNRKNCISKKVKRTHTYTFIYMYICIGWMKIFSADDESGESVNVSFLSSRYASADFSRGGLFKLQRDLDYPTEMADTLFG